MAPYIPTQDLRSFLDFLEARGELIRIGEPVDPCLEVTEIADRFVKAGENPALLFENPVRAELSRERGLAGTALNSAGRPVPLLINLFASKQRMAWALGCQDIQEAVSRIEGPLQMGPPAGKASRPLRMRKPVPTPMGGVLVQTPSTCSTLTHNSCIQSPIFNRFNVSCVGRPVFRSQPRAA